MKLLATAADGAVRTRQRLLAGGLLAGVLLVGFVGAVLYERRKPEALVPGPGAARTVPLATPGGALDPRDAWRGKEGAAIEEIKRQMTQLTDDMKRLRQEREQQRLDEQARERAAQLAALAGPPPAARPSEREAAARPAPPPPTLSPPVPRAAPQPGALPPGRPQHPGEAPSPGIFRLALNDGGAAAAPARGGGAAVPGEAIRTAAAASSARTRDTYLPSTAFMRAVLLSGLDAPTGGQAQNNPHPVLLRVLDHAQLPNSFRSDVKDCLVLGSGYGDLSSERAYVRTESLACIREGGDALDVPLKGVIVGPDGKAGVRGRLVTKTGQVLANALIAGLVSGLGTALTSGAIVQSVSPLGATQTIDPSKALQAGLGQGLARGLDPLVRYYISLADKIYPVIEVDAGQVVDVVVTRGVSVATGAAAPAGARDEPAGGREYFAHTRRR